MNTKIDSNTSNNNAGNMPKEPHEWPLWEVFVRSKAGLDHKHCGSLHAADAPMAIQLARDVYTRRQEGVSIWWCRPAASRRPTPRKKTATSTPWPTRSTATPAFTSYRRLWIICKQE